MTVSQTDHIETKDVGPERPTFEHVEHAGHRKYVTSLSLSWVQKQCTIDKRRDRLVHSKCHPASKPVGSQLLGDSWQTPKAFYSLQKGSIPSVRRLKYVIATLHGPVKCLSPAQVDAAPWLAAWRLHVDNLSEQLPQHLPWLENLYHCWADKMTVETHPLFPTAKLFARTIEVAHVCPQSGEVDWSVAVTIWCRDALWLAKLAYSDIGWLINLNSVVR